MAGEWRASTWGDEIALEYGRALRGHDERHGPYRVFGANGPIGWTSQPLAPGPGVILGRKGAYRGVQYSPKPFFVIDTAYYVVPKTELDMRWLYYAIKHYKLGEVDDGSPIPSTTRAAVYMLDLDVQQEGQRQKLELLVNSQVRVHEEWSYDNWNGGTYGHALFLTIPEALYLSAVRQREDLQTQIKADINNIHNVQNEFIDAVFLEMEALTDRDWRKDSGLLQPRRPAAGKDATRHIWGDDGYRLFLSHKSEVKKDAAKLKAHLQIFGVSCFVAHKDIQPTKEWQDEIELALASMDAFVALMTPYFHDSSWTDQEVGFALACGVPIIALKLGKDPYGFIGKFQALSCGWDAAAKELVTLLVRQPRMLDAYVTATERCSSFDNGNTLAQVLPGIQKLTDEQAQRLASAFNDNGELRGSFGFNGIKPLVYGQGLAEHLSRLTGRKHQVTGSGSNMRISG